MDFQGIVDSLTSPACIVSVEREQNDGYGEIRLAAGNKAYIHLLKDRMRATASDTSDTSYSFVPGLPYTEYFQQTINFEEIVFSAAVQKKDVHTYAHIYNVDVWFDIYVTPLDYEQGNTCYCLYMPIPNNDAYSLLDTFDSSSTANDVLKTCREIWIILSYRIQFVGRIAWILSC